MPSVVEPSFGLGRIMYCMFEHCYFTREQDKQRAVFGFTPLVAPTKATVFPLIQRPEMNQRAHEISQSLTRAGVSNIIDTTGGSSSCPVTWKLCVCALDGPRGTLLPLTESRATQICC